MWRFLVFKVFAARTVCKKQEQKYRTVSKKWLEIPYGVCVYWWGKSQCGEVRRKAKSDQCHVLEGQDDFVLKYGREIGKKMMGKPGNVHTVRC